MTLPRKILFFAVALLFAAPALAVDDVDKAAIEDLRALVAAECKAHPECPLDDLFSRLQEPIVANMTAFEVRANKYYVKKDDDDTDTTPDTQSEGITPDEWQALQISGIKDVHSNEYDRKSYALVDLDGDGQRDLVINNDITGEYDDIISTWAFHRQGSKFEGLASFRGDNYDGGFLYLDTGNGDTAGHWIRLHGRTYAVWRFTHYGYDDIYLLRPFVTNHEVPVLTVRYHYQFSVPVEQIKNQNGDEWYDRLKRETALSDEKLSEALTSALQSMSDKTSNLPISKTPICPIPASVKGDARKEYDAYSSKDKNKTEDEGEVADDETTDFWLDLPIWLGNKCYIGSLDGGKGIYTSSGLTGVMLFFRTPGKRDDKIINDWLYYVSGTRKMISVEISTKKCDRNGCY
jgi:hypothetical protein